MLSIVRSAPFLWLFAASACFAGQIYDITIDTSSQSGNAGAIYLQFNGGLNPDPASVSITSFSIGAPGGLSSTPPPFTDSGPGVVTGSLDSLPLTINNSTGLNDYEHYLVYGSTLRFEVSFLLPPTLTGASGSTFGFGLTAADGLTPVLTADPSGFNGEISYDTTAAFNVDTLGNGAIESIAAPLSGAPEPATVLLLASALALCRYLRRW